MAQRRGHDARGEGFFFLVCIIENDSHRNTKKKIYNGIFQIVFFFFFGNSLSVPFPSTLPQLAGLTRCWSEAEPRQRTVQTKNTLHKK